MKAINITRFPFKKINHFSNFKPLVIVPPIQPPCSSSSVTCSKFSITNVPQSICNELRESALNILKEQGNIVYGPIGSNIIFISNKKKPFFKVLYDVANSKVECQTDSCFRYKSFKFCSHTVAVAVHLKIFETYISKVKRSSTKDFVDNVVDISRNPNAGQKKTKSTQKRKGKANKNPKKL